MNGENMLQTTHCPVWKTWQIFLNLNLLIWSKMIHTFNIAI